MTKKFLSKNVERLRNLKSEEGSSTEKKLRIERIARKKKCGRKKEQDREKCREDKNEGCKQDRIGFPIEV